MSPKEPSPERPGGPEFPGGPDCLDWRAPGAIVLISCYELGRQPLGVASPLAFLRRAGFRPAAMDVAAERFDPEKAAGARLVGISVPMHTALRLGAEVARKVRAANPGCHICFYGLYALLNAGHLLAGGADSCADSCIGGECEGPLTALAEALAAGRPAAGVPGVATRAGAARPFLERLPLTAPAREGLPPLSAYARLQRGEDCLLAGAVETTRGCKHLCLHCPIPPVYGGRFFAVPREVVLEDIGRLAGAGARHITFADPDFLNGPAHAVRIVRAMNAAFPELTFDFTAKVEHLLREEALLPEMRARGCLFIVTAVESLSDTVLGNLGKGHGRAEVVRALGAVRGAGISLRPTFVAFTPWTRAEDYFDLLDFVEDNGLADEVDPVQLAIRLLVPPGSDLLKSPAMAPFLGELDAENFIHRWAHPDPRMDRLHEEVLALAEEAAEREEAPPLTFARIRARACAILDMAARAREAPPEPPPARPRPPRLTESWFC